MDRLRIRALVGAEDADIAAGAFYEADLPAAVVQEPGDLGTEEEPVPAGKVRLIAVSDDRAAAERAARILRTRVGQHLYVEIEPFVEGDWLQRFRAHHRAVRVGERLVIAPPWSRLRKKRGRIALRINPSLAFGTGSHASTYLCLRLLLALSRERPLGRVLDVGTGSGILALAALRLGAASARGIEPDPDALQAARENASLNRVRAGLLLTSEDARSVRGRFDVVLANLVRDLLLEASQTLSERVAPKGALIVSGILGSQAADVQRAYEAAGLNVRRRLDRQGWSALLFAR
jgi:ribosomal protein L11 methyltransferase